MKKTGKQIIALSAVVLILALIVAFVIAAIIGSSQLFQALLFCIIAVPILAWVCIWLYGRYTQKNTIADIFPETEADKALKEKAYRHHYGLPEEPEEFTEEEIIKAMDELK